MFGLMRLLAQIATQSAARRAEQTARKFALMVVALLLLLIGAGFLTAAGWSALHHWLGPVQASLGMGGSFVVLALILLALASRKPRPSDALALQVARAEAEARKAQAEAANLLAQLPKTIARAPALPLLSAFIGGLLLALKLRK